MFRIIIVPTNSGANAMLSYKVRETAEVAHQKIKEMQKGAIADQHVITARDDFGSVVTIDRANLCYALFIDVEKSQEIPMGGPGRIPQGSIPGARNVPSNPGIAA